jgi:hypothetical protein
MLKYKNALFGQETLSLFERMRRCAVVHKNIPYLLLNFRIKKIGFVNLN